MATATFTFTPTTRFVERISRNIGILTGTIALGDPDADGGANVKDADSVALDDYFNTVLAVNLTIPADAQNDGTNHYDYTYDIDAKEITCYQEDATDGTTAVIGSDLADLGSIEFVAFGLI